MAERVMLALGEFRFEIETLAYQKLALSQSWRWPEQARITREPALQFVGPGVREINLDGVIYPSFKGGIGQIETMRDMADEGVPLMLVDGLGRVWGRFVIEELSDSRTVFADNGQPRREDFAIKLKSYGEDGPASGGSSGSVSSVLDPFAGISSMGSSFGSLADSLSDIPAITSSMSPSALSGALDAVQGVVSGVTQTVGTVAGQVTGALGGALSGIRDAVVSAIPAGAMQAINDVRQAAGDVLAVGQELSAAVATVEDLPRALASDVAYLDGQLRLGSYTASSAARTLRDAEQTFTAMSAQLTNTEQGSIRQQASDIVGNVATAAERFSSACDQGVTCTSKLREKFTNV